MGLTASGVTEALTNQASRISAYDGIGWHVTDDHSPCPDHSAFADMNPGTDEGISGNPGSIIDRDGFFANSKARFTNGMITSTDVGTLGDYNIATNLDAT
jgi:hypothetical protein